MTDSTPVRFVLQALAVLLLVTAITDRVHAVPPPQAPTAREAAVDWLAQVDSGAYTDSWKAASPMFRAQISTDRWIDSITQARAPLGNLITREITGAQYQSNLPGVPPGDYVIFTTAADFQNHRGGAETLTVELVGGAWRVSGYFVR